MRTRDAILNATTGERQASRHEIDRPQDSQRSCQRHHFNRLPTFNPGIWDGKNQTLVTPKSLGLQVPKIYVYKARSRSIPSAARDKGPIFYSDQTQFSRGHPIMEPLPATLQLHNPVILPSFPVISQWPFINLSIHFRIKPPRTQPQVSASRHRRNRSVDSYQRKFAKISLISYL